MRQFVSIITLATALLGSLYAEESKEKKSVSSEIVNEANKLLHSGDLDKALSLLNDYLLTNPDNTRALRLRANINFAKDNYEASIKDFDRVVALNPRSAKAYLDRGIVYMAMESDEKAFDDIERAFVLNPDLAKSLEAKAGIGEKIHELREMAYTAKHQVKRKNGSVNTKKGGVITKVRKK